MALPPNWAVYTTDDGKEYFHNDITNTTQWDRPEWVPLSAGTGAGAGVDAGSETEVYKYSPTTADLELKERFHGADTDGLLRPGGHAHEAAGPPPGGGRTPDSTSGGLQQVSLASGAALRPSTGFGGGAGDSGGGSSASGVAATNGRLTQALVKAAGGDTATLEDGYSGIAGSAIRRAQQLFDVSSEEVIARLRASLVPFWRRSGDVTAAGFRDRPDFWGPFWVATTAVLAFAASGNYAHRQAVTQSTEFKADYGLVGYAACMVYGFLIGVPLLTRLGLYCTGLSVDAINFRQMICVYGYSMTATIPVSLVCLVPSNLLRWIAACLGMAVSLAFIRDNLWPDLANEVPALKWKVIGLFGSAQLAMFIGYRVCFLM